MLQRDPKSGRYILSKNSIPGKGYKECPICKKQFYYERAGGNKIRETCSKECRYKSCALRDTKIPRICVVCKKEFKIPPCWIKKGRGNDGTYCSVKCRWTGKINYTDKQKNDARNYVSTAISQGILDKKSCSICGEINAQAHHYKGYKKENWLDVIWYCHKHHTQEHERLRRLGLMELL